jgi:DNA-binding MarR family transcriptional regulator
VANAPGEQHESVGAWAKRYYLANRSAMEAVLRPFDLGSTQWYVLYQLTNDGPTIQRDLGQTLHLERATLSGIVSTLVRKGLIAQSADPSDQRQRMLRLTDAGRDLWRRLPDPVAANQAIAFDGADAEDLATAVRVLRAATERLSTQVPGAP